MAKFETKFGTGRQDWETPDEIFGPLNDEFHFTLDVCATEKNKKCEFFIDPQHDGLKMRWRSCWVGTKEIPTCWMNPPFGNQGKWVKKAWEESQLGMTVVCLLPARTNTNWWNDYCMKGEVRFIRGRPKFKGAKHGLPQPLAIVIFRPAFIGVPERHREDCKCPDCVSYRRELRLSMQSDPLLWTDARAMVDKI